jgi:hypothetical protein
MTSKYLQLPPEPGRTIAGLSDTGYDALTALADIVDNSIAAGANEVRIKIDRDYNGKVVVYIADNGHGMSMSALTNAMCYGSAERADKASLGKFGMGLKTASTAVCRRLSVVSRPDGRSDPVQMVWDVDHVIRTNSWEVEIPEKIDDGALSLLNSIAPNMSGTVVKWDKTYRFGGVGSYTIDEEGEHSATLKPASYKKFLAKIAAHLGLTFERFLNPEDRRAPNVKIFLNGTKVDPIDPFAKQFSTVELEKEIPIKLEGGSVPIKLVVYTLPHRHEIRDEKSRALIPYGNDRQGVYIYRENRLLKAAYYFDAYTKEPHYSLFRMEFSFGHQLDELFKVDIKKSQIYMDDAILERVLEFINIGRRAAEARFRSFQRATSKKASEQLHGRSNNAIQEHSGEIRTPVVVTDEKTGTSRVENQFGTAHLKIPILPITASGECFVVPVSEIQDGMLWEPALVEGRKAVKINTSHDYYRKVYLTNADSSITIQGIDFLLWAMGIAELNTVTDSSKRQHEQLRFEVSRILRILTEDMPEPNQ